MIGGEGRDIIDGVVVVMVNAFSGVLWQKREGRGRLGESGHTFPGDPVIGANGMLTLQGFLGVEGRVCPIYCIYVHGMMTKKIEVPSQGGFRTCHDHIQVTHLHIRAFVDLAPATRLATVSATPHDSSYPLPPRPYAWTTVFPGATSSRSSLAPP